MQKSVLVHAPVGFVEPDRSITIPRAAQNPLLQYLARCPHIKAATMYHDVHGFIRYHRTHRSYPAPFYAGQAAKAQGCPALAIRHFTDALQWVERAKPQHPDAGPPRSDLIVQARGGAHLDSQDYLRAVRDFSDGLTRGSANARWYGYRALAYMGMQAWDEALGDLDKVGERVYMFLENHYQDVPALESPVVRAAALAACGFPVST